MAARSEESQQKALFHDPVTQLADLLCGKRAFFGHQLEVGVPESLKDLPESRRDAPPKWRRRR